jgi:alpha-L-fucosidase 2
MKKSFLFLSFFLFFQYANSQTNGALKLWYTAPATVWNEALPIGNGRLGAMVYGNPSTETIQLNENTFWSGGPCNNNNPNALAALSNIRSQIFAGNWNGAQTLADANIKATTNQGQKYQTIGNLQLTFTGHSTYTNYTRELDISRAVFTSAHTVSNVVYKQEVFASKPNQVMVVRLSANQAGKIFFTATLTGTLKTALNVLNGNTLEMTGLSGTYEGVTGQVKSDTRVKILNTGGTISSTTSTVTVSGADEVVLLVSIATNFTDYKSLTTDEVAKCSGYLSAASSKSYSDLLSNHTNYYQALFNRVSLNLGTSTYAGYSTDVRLKNFAKTHDPEFVALYYQLGRYLLISSSQPGGQPANLQGIWNDQTDPVWDSKYTTNINLEMNYWPAEKTNLTEMHEPLVQMLKELAVTGAVTAQTMYGANGWVLHHNTDLWRTTGMVDGAYYGMWPTGGAWLSQHLWEKYIYSGDTTYLRSAYPVLRDACKFFQSFLVKEPKNNWLVVAPSMSPENNPSVHTASTAAGVTMDNQLLFDLFNKTIRAAKILKTDSALATQFKSLRDQLPPMQVGKYSQLQEWMDDWDSPTDHNRHVSHLYGLFPSNQISAYKTPELFDAARTSLIYRGDVSTGWSMGWKINLWARLFDGNHAFQLINNQLTYVDPAVTSTSFSGGTYPNLFDAHPPFQIDGNFGCTSGITEMLMQSHDGLIQILPAMPDDWKTGEIKGLRAYGGFDVDFSWSNGEIQKVTIHSKLGGNCRIRVPNVLGMENGQALTVASGLNPNAFFVNDSVKQPIISASASLNKLNLKKTYEYDFQTEAGKTYSIISANEPTLVSARITQQNPDKIYLQISTPVVKQNYYSGFSAKINNQAAAIDSVVWNDSLSVVSIKLHNPVSKTDNITLSYSNGNVSSVFQVALGNFTDALVHNLITGSAPTLLTAECNSSGSNLSLNFSKDISSTTNQASAFTLYVNGIVNAISDLSVSGNIITLYPTTTLHYDDVLTLRYTPGTTQSTDSGLLAAFSNVAVKNNITEPLWLAIPGKIEAENYYLQTGTVTEACSDASGGNDVGYIDTNDWMEYAVNIANTGQYKASFRLGSINSTGLIYVYVDGVKIAQLNVPNTTGWQTYSSTVVNLSLSAGKHFIKLFAATGGFNINWVSYESIQTGVENQQQSSETVKISPVPAKNHIIIESPDFCYKEVQILNTTGNIMLSQNGYYPLKQLNLHLPSGIYIVRLIGSKKMVNKKISIN